VTRLRRLLVAALVAAAGVPASAASERLVFVGSSTFPPYQYLDGAGLPRGFNVELMRALARETRIDIDVRLVSAGASRRLVERGEADLLCLGFNQERAHRFTWLLPLWRLRQVAVFARRPERPVGALHDLTGAKILVGRGSLAWEEVRALPSEKRPLAIEFPDNDFLTGARRLRSGEGDVMFGNALTIAQQGVYTRYPDLHETTYKSIPYYLAATSGREDLQPLFFAAFTRLQESGEFNAIVERTLLRAAPQHMAEKWASYLVYLFAVVATALLGVATWNRTLRSQVDARTREFRAVAERLEFHGVVQSQVSDGIIVVNGEERITMWNAGAEATFDIPAAEALGTPVEMVVTPGVLDVDVAAVRKEVEREGFWRGEAKVRRRNGTEVHVDATVKRLRQADGVPDGRLIVIHDIDALKRAERERRKLELQIQHVQKLESLGVLAGGIAHDFNNLLVGMMGHAGLALMDLPPDSSVRERLEQIETCAMRAAELTNQMLAYSGKGRVVVQPTDLTAVVQEMANLLQTVVSKSARLELQLAPNLPALQADGAQLRQVVMNLITNASDAIGERGGTIAVTTGVMHASTAYLAEAYVASMAESGEYVYIEVHDDGCGMDADTRERIFEPFFTTKFTGRGLGLAAVLGIVRGHHGAVHLESAPGCGTTFRILFPACASPATAAAGQPGRARASKQARVLVVDDEPAVRTIAREALTRAGFTVMVAEDGVAALERLRAEASSIDAVLLDVTMPGPSGIDTLRAIRAIVHDLPVVLMSGYSEQEAADRLGEEAIAGFLQKPFSPAAVVAKVNDALAAEMRR
jgi:PAS domain S-box-containing protein